MLSDFLFYLSGWIPLGIWLLVLVGLSFTAIWTFVWLGTGFWDARHYLKLLLRGWVLFIVLYTAAWFVHPASPIPTRIVLISPTSSDSTPADWYLEGLSQMIRQRVNTAHHSFTILDQDICPVLDQEVFEPSKLDPHARQLNAKWLLTLEKLPTPIDSIRVVLSKRRGPSFRQHQIWNLKRDSFSYRVPRLVSKILETISGSPATGTGQIQPQIPDSAYQVLFTNLLVSDSTESNQVYQNLLHLTEQDPQWFWPRRELARWLLDHQPGLRKDEIRNLLITASQAEREDAESLRLLGEVLLRFREWDDAESAFKLALSKNPFEPRTYFFLSRLNESRFSDLDWKTSPALLKRALHLASGYERARLHLAQYYSGKLERYAALAVIDQGLVIDPESVPLLLSKSAAMVELSKHRETVEICQQILELEPGQPGALYNLGIAHLWLKEYDRAIACFDSSYKNGGTVDNLYYLGMAYQRKGEWEEATKWFQRRFALPRTADDKIAISARNLANKLIAWIAERDSTKTP